MKTREEINALKTEFENVCGKLSALSEEELKQVTGGCYVPVSGFPFVQGGETSDDQTLGGPFNSSSVIQEREERLR